MVDPEKPVLSYVEGAKPVPGARAFYEHRTAGKPIGTPYETLPLIPAYMCSFSSVHQR
ncbi:hypothetical protein JOD69_003674 [Methylocaldum sp. RMAD-M]|jgi:hypothetical protein|nr:hypothetical protein [Methylocaldum sp. RMAD-M]